MTDLDFNPGRVEGHIHRGELEEAYERMDVTPNDELRDLIDEWRTDPLRTAKDCADELEALLGDGDE